MRSRAQAAGTGPWPGMTAGSSRPGSPGRASRVSVGEDQVHLDRHRVGGGLAGDAFDQGVGHDLPAAAGVAGGDLGVGVAR